MRKDTLVGAAMVAILIILLWVAGFQEIVDTHFQEGYGTDYGIIASMDFEEGTGSVTYDQSPYGNDGTITGASWAAGKYGMALTFDGNDFVTLSDSDSLDLGAKDNITIEAWARDPPTWYDHEWLYRKKLTFDNSASTENLVSFPVLVKLDATVFDFSEALANGDDLIFTDSDEITSIAYELEEYDSLGEEASIWVNVPQIDAGSITDHIWMYYGNSGASSAEDIEGTWNTDFILVQHLPDNSTTTTLDSTQYNRDGVKSGINEPQEATGHIVMAQHFDGADDLITVGAVDTFTGLTDGTVEFWANVSEGGDVFVAFKDTSNYVGIQISSNDLKIRSRIGGTVFFEGATTSNTFFYNNFSYGVWTKSGTTHKLFINGVDTAITWVDETDKSVYFDDVPNPSSGLIGRALVVNWTNGTIDEFRISNSSRSDEWVEAQNLSMADLFIGYGSEEYSVDKIIVQKLNSYVLGITDTSTLIGMIGGTESTATIDTVTDWHYYAMTYDGANIRLYIDGVLVDTTACAIAIPLNNEDVLIGDRFLGEIDQVRIYSECKTLGEIKNHYINSKGLYSRSVVVSDDFRVLNSTLNEELQLNEYGLDLNQNYLLNTPLDSWVHIGITAGVADIQISSIPAGLHTQDKHYYMLHVSLDAAPGGGKEVNVTISNGVDSLTVVLAGAVENNHTMVTAFDWDASAQTITLDYGQTAGGASSEACVMMHWYYIETP